MKSLLVIFLFLTITMSGCYSTETIESTNVSPVDVYQSYSIRADKDRTSVTATFRVGSKSGTTIDLDAPGKIEYNGKQMPEIAPTGWKGTTYEVSVNKFTGQHQFLYTDGNGKTLQSEISFQPVEFGDKVSSVSRSVRTLVPLSRVIGKDETITAYISGKTKPAKNKSNEDSSDSVTIELDPSRAALIIEPEQLKSFTGGSIDVELKIEKTESIKPMNNKGGEIQISYETQGISLSIVK